MNFQLQYEILVITRCLSAPDATFTSLTLEPSSIFYYLRLHSGMDTERSFERVFVRYLCHLLSIPQVYSAFPASWGHGQSYASISHALLNCA